MHSGDTSCVSGCAVNEYLHTSDTECDVCTLPCIRCDGAGAASTPNDGNCLRCDNDGGETLHFIDISNNVCVASCGPGQYYDTFDGTGLDGDDTETYDRCTDCHADCATCAGPNSDDCLSCDPSHTGGKVNLMKSATSTNNNADSGSC